MASTETATDTKRHPTDQGRMPAQRSGGRGGPGRCIRCGRFVAPMREACERCAAIMASGLPSGGAPAQLELGSVGSSEVQAGPGQRAGPVELGAGDAGAVEPDKEARAPFLAAEAASPPAVDDGTVFLRARSEFIVPRPSELHPPAWEYDAEERRYLLPRIRPPAATPPASAAPVEGRATRKRPRRWIGPREIIAMVVIGAAAGTGAVIAILSGGF